jgi:RHS repeat-associated protein
MGRIKEDRWFGGTVIKSNYYDAAGQLTNWVVKGSNWTSGRRAALTYDAGGRIVTQKLSYANGGLMTTNVYGYDLTDQLLSGSGTATYSAMYDAVGNRTNADGRVYTVNYLNMYTALTSPSQGLTYDANGNLTNWNGTSFLHDSQGQLTNLSASSYASKLYDYRRLRWFEGAPPYSGIAYTYDARGSLLDRHDTPGNASQTYAYADGIDEAVVLNSTGGSYGNGLFAVIRDHLGSVVAIVDSMGHLVETYDYSPFGKTTIHNRYGQTISTSDVGNTLSFTGREKDGSYYYYRNRWYSPDLGRFLEPDPIGLAGWDVNIYRYVGNNPLWWVDPFGLDEPGDPFAPIKPPPLWPPAPPDGGSSCSVDISGTFPATPVPTTPGKVIPTIAIRTPVFTVGGSVTISVPGGPETVGGGFTLKPDKGFGAGWTVEGGITSEPPDYHLKVSHPW